MFNSVVFAYNHNSNPVCSAVRQVYQNSACCGEGGGSAVCVSPSVPSTALGRVDCFAAVQSTHSVLPGCESILQWKSATRTKLSGSHVAQDSNAYTRYLSSNGDIEFVWMNSSAITTSIATAESHPFRNFQHSMTITPDYLLLGVWDDSAASIDQLFGVVPTLSGVYKLDRNTLQPLDYFGGPTDYKFNVMRYAPVVADNYVFSVNCAMHLNSTSTQKGYLYRTPLNDFSTVSRRDIMADFGVTHGGAVVTGPLATQVSDDSTCGTRIFVGSASLDYLTSFNVNEQSRPLGLSVEERNRGRVGCYCSLTLAPCPSWTSGYYYNGKPDPLPASFGAVQEMHVNRGRSDFLGTIRQVSCTNLASLQLKTDRVIPYAFTVTLSGATTVNNVLYTADNKIKLWVIGGANSTYNVSYWGGYYNTPTTGLTLLQYPSGSSVTLTSVTTVILDHAYTKGVITSGQPGYPSLAVGLTIDGNARLNSAIAYVSYAISSFTDSLTIPQSILDTCATTNAFAAVKVSPVMTEDFSGVTLKMKYAVGDAIPPDGQKATFSTGASFANPCAVDDSTDTLYCPSGNAGMQSFDRQQVLRPVAVLKDRYEAARVAAVNAGDFTALKAAIGGHAEVLALNAQQMALLSPFEAHFKEDAIHAIDTKTGQLKWATQIEGVDSFFMAFNSLVMYDFYWNDAAISALGAYSQAKDNDANGVAFKGDLVYAATKGARFAIMDKTTGELFNTHQYAPNTVVGGSAFGGFCVTSSGIAVAFATTDPQLGTSWHQNNPYSWITDSGTRITNGNSILAAWDPVRDVELWAIEIQGGQSQGAVSCIEDRVIAVCPGGVGTCNYDAFKGTISQTIIPNPKYDKSHAFSVFHLTSMAKSMICDGPECWTWNDGAYVNKFVMV